MNEWLDSRSGLGLYQYWELYFRYPIDLSLIHQIDLAVGRKVRRFGFPIERLYWLLKLRRILAHPVSYMRRLSYARRVLRKASRRGVIPKHIGYAPISPNAFPNVDALVEICVRIFAQRQGVDATNAPKPFYANLLDEQDLISNPEILEFALND